MKRIIPIFVASIALLCSCKDTIFPLGDYTNDMNADNDPEIISGKVIISKEEVLEIIKPVIDKYPDRWVNISKNIVPAKSHIQYCPYGVVFDGEEPSKIVSPDYDAWVAVIGPDARLNGPQEQLHLFINAISGKWTETTLWGQAILDWDTSGDVIIDTGEDIAHLVTKKLQVSPSSNPTKWAVLLSGGVDREHNFDRYWNDCQYAYVTLTQTLGYPINHIFCLMSDGVDTYADRRIGINLYDNSPVDFDNDGFIDVQYPATKSSITSVFNYLSSVVSAGDELLLFVTDHGGPNGEIYLWNNQSLSPSELYTELNKIPDSVTVDVVMGQCFSGVYASGYNRRNRTIVTATRDDEPSAANTVFGGYDYFLKYWTDAINNINPNVSGSHSNGDGYLSSFEVYHYAWTNPRAASGLETPQYISDSDLFFWGHDLEGNHFVPYISGVDMVSTVSSTSQFQLYDLPSGLSPTWLTSDYLNIISGNASSATVSGRNMPSSQYVSLHESLSAAFTDLGKNFTIKKNDISVWQPGAYIGNNLIVGNGNYYYLVHYPTYGTYPGTYGYQWSCTSPQWQITSQNGASAFISHAPGSGSTELSVYFYDPFGNIIYVSDQVN